MLIAGPLTMGCLGLVVQRRSPPESRVDSATPWNWRLTVASALLYTLAFNLVFFIQELFLVWPKALTPGLRATLYHNNHSWAGDNPLAALLQGTGALAILLVGLGCSLLLRLGWFTRPTARIFVIWLAYNGFMMSLSQVVIGAVEPENDVGMAMNYLHLSATAKTAAALAALAAIPLVVSYLRGPLLTLAGREADTARGRARHLFLVATLPALMAIPLIIPFRVPRNFVEVVMVPVVETLIGVPWIQAGAWRARGATPPVSPGAVSIVYPLGAVLVVLLVFQLVLRPGIHFN